MTVSQRSHPRIATLGPDDAEAFITLDEWAFAPDLVGVDQAPIVACFEWDRSRGAFLPDLDGVEQLAGINSVFSLDLPVPGGSVAAGGLTWVGVHPAYRRRGVLTALIREHLNAVHNRGEPISALWATEPGIYGRFGYGIGTRNLRATVPRGAALRDVPGADQVRLRLETADVERHGDLVGDGFRAAGRSRPGMVSPDSPAHRRLWLADPPRERGGAERLRILIAEADEAAETVDGARAGGTARATDTDEAADANTAAVADKAGARGAVRGYALFRRRGAWDEHVAGGTVLIKELVARDPATARALWGRLLDLDLTTRVLTDNRATDDPLFQLLIDPRSVQPVVTDGLWLRLVDLPAALAARRYSAELDVVLEVRDELCPWNAGRWHLRAGPDRASCTPSTDPAAFTLDVRELAQAYLGSTSLHALAAAGQVTITDPAGFALTSRALTWPVTAYSPRVF